jgi:hypothetical protein
MLRYYFHVRRGQLTLLDHEGSELADTVDTEREAAKTRATPCELGFLERTIHHSCKHSGSRLRILSTALI